MRVRIKELSETYEKVRNDVKLMFHQLIERVGDESVYLCSIPTRGFDLTETVRRVLIYEELEDLTTTYYNNKNGVEIPCYLLGVVENRIVVIEHATNKPTLIEISEINGLDEQIDVMSEILKKLEVWEQEIQ